MMVFQSFQTSSGLKSVSFLYGSCADETSIILLWFLCPSRDPVYPLSKYFLFMVVVKTYVRFQTKTIGVYLPVLATIFVGYCVLLCAIGAPSTTKQVQARQYKVAAHLQFVNAILCFVRPLGCCPVTVHVQSGSVWRHA